MKGAISILILLNLLFALIHNILKLYPHTSENGVFLWHLWEPTDKFTPLGKSLR